MRLPTIRHIEPMTVGELKQKIKTLPNDTPVYLLVDKSPENWDEENDRWSRVYPLSYVTRERLYNSDGYGKDELNCLLEVEEE